MQPDQAIASCINIFVLHILILKSIYNQRRTTMPKDSQLDPKHIRKEKANDSPTFAESQHDGESRNHKKQSGSRTKPGNDK